MVSVDGQSALDRVRRCVERDIHGVRREYWFSPPGTLRKPLLRVLNDSRDEPLLYLFLNVACTTLPAAVAMLVGWLPQSHLLGALYFGVTYGLFLQRFILALHYSEHRPIFNKDNDVLNRLPSLVLAPLFGIPIGMYRLHHCIMHHTEDNVHPGDLSSTEPYQRDSLLHFLTYWVRFGVATWVELPWYALRKGRYGQAVQCLAGEVLYFGGGFCLWSVRPVAALWVVVIPFLVSSLALMFGNWSQHIFLDPSDPANDYKLAYNCVAALDNQSTFNDGYHVVHHLNSRVHWADMPARFLETLEQHAKQDALVFEGLHFFDVGMAVMLRQYCLLARHLLPLSGRLAAMSTEEKVEMLRGRLRPILRTK